MHEIERVADSIIKAAWDIHASDIHFVPQDTTTLIEFRINSHLYEFDYLSSEEAKRLIAHFKFRSGMDIGDYHRPQNGAFDYWIHKDCLHLRFSTLPIASQESLCIRLLPQAINNHLGTLTLFPETSTLLHTFLNYENGLLLIAGPTGAGKTTTLYALLMEAKKRYNSRIITLEDPIEKRHPQFVQMEVNERSELTFYSGFKAILRHDPDIIMVGEIRDQETAIIAIRAALSGKLVLSTVHAVDALGALRRMTELGISPFDLKETLIGITAQRLVTIQCPRCGPVCQKNCPKRLTEKDKRTALFEVLTGMPLHQALNAPQTKRHNFKRLDDYYEEAYALGYIPHEVKKAYDQHPNLSR